MAGKFERSDVEGHGAATDPPALARSILTWAADPLDKVALIGDLQEEFTRLSKGSPRDARAWYWRQTSHSLPHLAMKRLRSDQAKRLGMAVVAVIAAFSITVVWDMIVARNAARGFYALTNAEAYGPTRAVFLATQMAGVAIAGALIAFVMFRRRDNFMRNAVLRLAPAALVVFAPAFIDVVMASPDYPVTFRLFWVAFAAPSFVIGAWIAFRHQSGRTP